MRLKKEDYNKAVGILKRYNYNCLNIINTRADTLSLSAGINDGTPKAQYKISDTVCDTVIQLEENKELQKSILEYKIVRQALELVSNDARYIFEELYQKNKTKWEIINSGMSERTFGRRKKELIYEIDKEIKKMA